MPSRLGSGDVNLSPSQSKLDTERRQYSLPESTVHRQVSDVSQQDYNVCEAITFLNLV